MHICIAAASAAPSVVSGECRHSDGLLGGIKILTLPSSSCRAALCRIVFHSGARAVPEGSSSTLYVGGGCLILSHGRREAMV